MTLSFDSPEVLKTAEWFYEMSKYNPPDAINSDIPVAPQRIYCGQQCRDLP